MKDKVFADIYGDKLSVNTTYTDEVAYGAAAKTIAESTGMDVKDVEALIAAEVEMYPEVEEFYADVTDSAIRLAKAILRAAEKAKKNG